MVPVFAYVPPGSRAPYVLLDQVSSVPLAGTNACQVWECIFQLTVVTEFDNQGDDEPSYQLQEQLLNLLQGTTLVVDQELQAHPIQIQLLRKATEYNQKTVAVLRYIRLKVRVYQNI